MDYTDRFNLIFGSLALMYSFLWVFDKSPIRGFPTWAVTKLLLFLDRYKKHPWQNLDLTLRNWHAHQTNVCKSFDRILWINVLLIADMAVIIYYGAT